MSHGVCVHVESLLSCAFSGYAQNAPGSHNHYQPTEGENLFIFSINKAADKELALHLGKSVSLLITLL